MGKAARTKKRKRVAGFPDYPYADAFTEAEIEEILRVKDSLLPFFRDAIKPDGTILGIDEGTLQLLLLHGAMAGVRGHEELGLIRGKRLPDETGRFVDSVEWIPARFDSEKARREDAEEEARRRKAAMDVHMAQLSPEAREAFDRLFVPAAREAFTVGPQRMAERLKPADQETQEATDLRRQAERLREEGQL